jgi:hypothetical protein
MTQDGVVSQMKKFFFKHKYWSAFRSNNQTDLKREGGVGGFRGGSVNLVSMTCDQSIVYDLLILFTIERLLHKPDPDRKMICVVVNKATDLTGNLSLVHCFIF